MQVVYFKESFQFIAIKNTKINSKGLIRNCLQGAGDFRDQTGAAYWCHVRQADRGKR